MIDGPHWFAPKRHGFGSGLPIAWQGWAVLAIYGLVVAGGIWLLKDHPLAFAAVLASSTAIFIMICARTTRGGWRWRSGGED